MIKTRWGRWQDWPLGAKFAATLTLPLALMLLALLFSFRLQQGSANADADVRRALAIKAEIQTLHSLVAESATSVRGYLLTGRDEFLVPYRSAQRELPVTLTTLRRNIRDPEMKARLENIQSLLQQKLDSLDELKDHGRALAPAALQSHLLASKAVLDALRAEIRAMDNREADLLARYSVQARQVLLVKLWFDLLTTVLVLATGIGAYFLLLSGVVHRVQRLTLNAERLVHDQALDALPIGRDELGQLAERLHNASVLLAARAEQARAASEAKTHFLSRTSHELRTPLNAILGFAQLLELDGATAQQKAYAGHTLTAGRHLLTLIDQVLDIARIESRELHLTPAPQSVAGLVTEAVDLLAPLAAENDIRITVAPQSRNVTVLADGQRLRQVLLNVLSNAVKYNRKGGSVKISAQQHQDRAYIAIADTGIGIATAELSRLFTPFDRLAAEHSPVQGTGLGLAVSCQLMRCMNGAIAVTSTLGQGSCFTLDLPLAQSDAAPAIVHAAEVLANDGEASSRCLLVIEDNPSNLALVQAVVARRPEWRLVSAADGEAGCALAQELHPDLIFLDLHLPGLGGEAVLATLRADPHFAATPIVILSADALPATIQRLRAAGANDYLVKPLAVPRLLALLAQKAP